MELGIMSELKIKIKSVLFVCIHNSSRSQMAEAFLKDLSNNFKVDSAGIFPGKLNKLVVKSLKEVEIDISNNKTKSVESLLLNKTEYDFFIFVCSESQGQKCPIIPYKTTKIYWDIEDPSTLKGNENEKIVQIRKIRNKIKHKVQEFIAAFSA
tara:strand:- start:178 stop:636 length:459 start_codon:yes stop_codon:yes gene_type:complete